MDQHSSTATDWSERFVVRDMGEEVLVYDLTNQRITSLNKTAARVWKASGGQADIASISKHLATEPDGGFDTGTIERSFTCRPT